MSEWLRSSTEVPNSLLPLLAFVAACWLVFDFSQRREWWPVWTLPVLVVLLAVAAVFA